MPDAPTESLLPQLCMRLTIEPGSNIPISNLPVGYELRGYEPGDESKWADLINLGGLVRNSMPIELLNIWNLQKDVRDPV